ncbi:MULTISPECIES: CHAT domain-containing protein [Cyanophyceae]|uniref:CHAT domain-containing protein n=1 Tax=Leptolyngbya subtilissima DQ-A4 TaxID=2933933 RepID=A0ABV0K329_9CYAN|nr:CHAT domain-containing protein [Nodosilinea sp. FACHB-141]MBD2113162.1 CHAT domain-containing protein [Nodosilinea sp. FACHB-141]
MRSLLLPALLWATLTVPAWAQSIIPAADGTGTLVMPDGSTYQITGGTLSGDGANLFHSFEQFGLTATEVANFLADPTVQNILGRVVGGNASVINGLLQVSGSSANLYLLNPAGILFGPNSALNLDGSFAATTASGVGFEENWLQAMGDTNYAALTGNPTAFAFGNEPGALINLSNLAVNPGEVITLASGSVINLGTLTAPGGQIIVLAVPGENRVSIRPEGAILSLELATLPEEALPTAPLPFSPLDIPSLLRAGGPEVATGIITNPDGTVSLTGSATTLPTSPGTALVSGTLDVAGETGGEVQVLGDRIAVTAATIDASGTQGGGTVLVGGDYQGSGTTPTSDRTYVDATSTLTADALATGDGGEVIVWADQGTQFDGTITAHGGAAAGDGGLVEVSGRDTLAFKGTVDVSTAQGEWGTLLLDPTNITISAAVSSPGVEDPGGLPDILATDLPGDVTINATLLQNQTGNIILEATDNITIDNGLSLNFVPGGSITFTADTNIDGVGDFTMDQTQAINAQGTAGADGRDVTITAVNITTGAVNTTSAGGTAGNVDLTATNSGGISAGNIVAGSVFAISNGATPFNFGDISATNSILLGKPTGSLIIGNLSATTGNIGVGTTGGGGINVDIGNATAGTSINLDAGIGGTITTGDLSAGTQVNASTGVGGNLTTGAISSGPGVSGLSINLEADEIDFLGGVGTIRAPGQLLIQTADLSQAIAVGGAADSGAGTLDLTATDLAAFANGFSSITIGRPDNAGDINLAGDVTFSDPTTLQTLGSIDTTGTMLNGVDDASLNLLAGSGVDIGEINTVGRSIVIEGDRIGNSEGSVTVGQPITTGGGDITITGASTGFTIFSTGRAIFIDSQGAINSQGGNISLTGTTTTAAEGIISFAPITSGGGDIVLTGSSFGGGDGVNLSFLTNSVDSGGGDITITGTGLNTGITISSGVTVAAGTGNVTLNANDLWLEGLISGSGSLQIQLLTPSFPITLGGTGDPIRTTFLNQNEINQIGNGFSNRTIGQVGNTGPITLESFTLSSPLTIVGGVLTGPGQDTAFTTAPDSSLEVGGFGATLRLLNPTEIRGGSGVANTVLGGDGDDTFTVIGDGTAQVGNITFSNISAFDGGAGSDTLAGTGANDYFVVNSSNGGYTLNSSFLQDINFTNVEAIAAGGGAQDVVELVSVPLDLAVSGDTLFVTSQGSVTINANVTTPGDLIVSASAGDVAQTGGQVTVGGSTSLDAPGNITLDGSNDFNAVTVTSGQNVTLRDRNSLQLNELVFSGGLQVTAGGNLAATTNLQPGSSTSPMGLFATDSSLFAADSSILATDSLAGISLTSGGSLTTANIVTFGGPIALQAGGAITSGNLDSSGSNGGAVRLQAGDSIQVNSINAQGTTSGGTITALTPSTFRVVGSFTDQNAVTASLSTVGGSQGGEILLGYGASTFILGDPSFNGTLAAITTGDVTLLPDVANPILGSRIFGRGLPGQIQFISFGDIPVEIEPPPDEIDPVPDPQRDLETIEENAPVFLTSAGDVLGQEQLSEAEDSASGDFAGYFGDLIKSPRSVNLQQARATLRDIAAQTGEMPAFMYVRLNRDAKPGEGGVELLLITAEGEPSQVRVLNTTAEEVLKTQEQLRRQLTNPSLTNNTAYLTAAQQLYGWLIAPIEAELKAVGVTNIGFVMDAGLRTLPLAALHNGERFLIEDYSLGLIPSLGLIDPTYVDLNRQNSTLLVSGASQFINQPPLLAAEVEMQTLQSLWPSTKVAETRFTVSNLQRDRRQAQIIHMATHAQFLRGAPNNSYLQFFDSRLRLNQVPELGWFDPQVELVTLSACQTAIGNADAELGFAGFALLAGAKSALASLWKVNDEATAGLMITFYQSLDQEAIKAEALREAQLAMVRGQVYTENGQLIWPSGSLALPPDLVIDGRQDLSHPFYWAAFTMVGSPW